MTDTPRERYLVDLVNALDALLAHYRVGTRPSGALLDRITRLRTKVGPTR